MDQFILVSGRLINVEQISFIDLQQEDTLTIHIGANSVTAEGEEAAKLRAAFMKNIAPLHEAPGLGEPV